MTRIIKVVIACHNFAGEPDFAFVRVTATAEQFENGEHYDCVHSWAEANSYESPLVCFDEDDCGSFPWLLDHFEWDSASVIAVGLY